MIGPERKKHRMSVTIDVSPGNWKDTYGEYPTSDGVRSYVRQVLSKSAAAEEDAFVNVFVKPLDPSHGLAKGLRTQLAEARAALAAREEPRRGPVSESCAPTCYRDTDNSIAHSPECPAVHLHPAEPSPQDVLWRTVVERDELREALAAAREDTERPGSSVEVDLHNALLEINMDWSDWGEAEALARVLQIADDALKGRPQYSLAREDTERPEEPLTDDLKRLADIGDQVLAGAPIEGLKLGEFETLFVVGYCTAEKAKTHEYDLPDHPALAAREAPASEAEAESVASVIRNVWLTDAGEAPKQEPDRLLDFLAGQPSGNCIASSSAVVREMMLQTGGWMMACGEMYDIQSQPLPGGVYRITLSRKAFS